ncbi:MAG: SGNH/GDSL hydrolase family protein [Sorangiineae bacterium]|nr:SGNH/GDSL hydrolase family protein [Polyangiaceae bacterium]MEB2321482.1 SGNH/GDSL hydrolase family protein [Sorangiineae bacterium]
MSVRRVLRAASLPRRVATMALVLIMPGCDDSSSRAPGTAPSGSAPAPAPLSAPSAVGPLPSAPPPAPARARPPTATPVPDASEQRARLVWYPADRVQSPITARVAASLREIAARDPSLRADVFAKLGDSITASADFLYCFSRRHRLHHVDLGERGDLAPTLEFFRRGDAGGRDPFFRESRAAAVGWSAWKLLRGAPTPLEVELHRTRARFALVMYGTNDLEAQNPQGYARDLFEVVDVLTRRGTIPLLSSIPPRLDKPSRDTWVPRYNAIVRGVAMRRAVPFVDYHRALESVPRHGLTKFGIHPSTYAGRLGFDACDLRAAGLEHGYNVRNLVSLDALDRARRALEADAALDPEPPAPPGQRSERVPLEIGALPFVDAPEPSEQGTFYALELPRARRVHVLAVSPGARPSTVRVSTAERSGAPLSVAGGGAVLSLDAGRHVLEVRVGGQVGDLLLIVSDAPTWSK